MGIQVKRLSQAYAGGREEQSKRHVQIVMKMSIRNVRGGLENQKN